MILILLQDRPGPELIKALAVLVVLHEDAEILWPLGGGIGSRDAAALFPSSAMEKNESTTQLNFCSVKFSGKKVVVT